MVSTRLRAARKQTRFWRTGRELLVALAGGGLAIVALIVFGKPEDPVKSELIVVSSAAVAAALVPVFEFLWNFAQIPKRNLQTRVSLLEQQLAEAKPNNKELARQLRALRAIQLELEKNRRKVIQIRATRKYGVEEMFWSAEWREHRDGMASSLALQSTYVACREAYALISTLRVDSLNPASDQLVTQVDLVDSKCVQALREIESSLQRLGVDQI